MPPWNLRQDYLWPLSFRYFQHLLAIKPYHTDYCMISSLFFSAPLTNGLIETFITTFNVYLFMTKSSMHIHYFKILLSTKYETVFKQWKVSLPHLSVLPYSFQRQASFPVLFCISGQIFQYIYKCFFVFYIHNIIYTLFYRINIYSLLHRMLFFKADIFGRSFCMNTYLPHFFNCLMSGCIPTHDLLK